MKKLLLLPLMSLSAASAMQNSAVQKKVFVFRNFQGGITPLMKIAQAGLLDQCMSLVPTSDEINKIDGIGRTALLWAVGGGHLGMCRYLIEHGADLNVKDIDGFGIVAQAARGGHYDVCKYLHAIGAEITEDEIIKTLPLVVEKGYAEVCRFLLELDDDSQSMLINGVASTSMASLRASLDAPPQPSGQKKMVFIKGCDQHIRFRKTTLEDRRAVLQFLEEECQRRDLVNGDAVDLHSAQSQPGQQIASQVGERIRQRKIARRNQNEAAHKRIELLASTAVWSEELVLKQEKSQQLLDLCMRLGYWQHSVTIEQVLEILDQGADVNVRTASGHSPLLIATMHASRPLAVAISELLISRGADVFAKTITGFTTLINAAENEQFTLCELILNKGVPVNAKTNAGITALHKAVQKRATDLSVLLLSHGADAHSKDKSGMTPFMNVFSTGQDLQDVIDIRLVKAFYPADGRINLGLNDGCMDGWTPLMVCASRQNNSYELCELLVASSDLSACDRDSKETALMKALNCWNLRTALLLVEKGACLHLTKDACNELINAIKSLDAETKVRKAEDERIARERMRHTTLVRGAPGYILAYNIDAGDPAEPLEVVVLRLQEEKRQLIELIRVKCKDNVCGICFEEQADTLIQSCKLHRTCKECGDEWALKGKSKTCPFCRQ